jgi:AcrR family transcriptional regulator
VTTDAELREYLEEHPDQAERLREYLAGEDEPDATCPVPAGLRERKKLATRRALGMAAMRLSVERGLDNVLVEDIADAAGVSTRTFNNYFGSKYEAICSLQLNRAMRIGAALRARPAGEPLWEAISHAVVPEFADRQPDEDWMAGVRLVVSSPALRGESLKVQGLAQYDLAAAIAERAGADLATDMFPRILAGAISAALQAATERWLHSDPPVPVKPLIEQALARLAEGMREVLPPPPVPEPDERR